MANFDQVGSAETEDPELQEALLMSLCQDPQCPSLVGAAAACASSSSITSEAKKLLRKVLGNVIKDENNKKLRQLRTSNPKVQVIWVPLLSRRVLEEVGFRPTSIPDQIELPIGEEFTSRARRAVEEFQLHLDEGLASLATTHPASATSASATIPPPPISSRPNHCALCTREVRKHNFPPRGMLMMRARADWEGLQCDTCWQNKNTWHVICGGCYNGIGFSGGTHVSHLWSSIGHGTPDETETGSFGARRSSAPPPPGRPGSRPGRR
jgi:hypothetical protein